MTRSGTGLYISMKTHLGESSRSVTSKVSTTNAPVYAHRLIKGVECT